MFRVPDGVVATKLVAPVVSRGLVSRARLHDRVSVHAGSLILVCAPAGFGKTALVADWLRRCEAPAAWFSLDATDNDPTRFYNHLAAAISQLPLPDSSSAAAEISTLAHGSASMAEVAAAFRPVAGAVLVLDDVHELEEPRLLAAIANLAAARMVKLVLLTRVDPSLPLGRLRVSGELLEIREHDLRFTADESAILFRESIPGGLEDELRAELDARTEGWAAGLRLAAIALRDATDRAAAVADFTGSDRLVFDYLVEEALQKQPRAVQQFLMDTSVLERFSAEAAAAVTEDAAAHDHLAHIEAANLFLIPLGADRVWFRYHHLFRQLLEYRLRRLRPERLQQLHARAAQWYAGRGDIRGAMEHACNVTDRTLLCGLLDRHVMSIIARSELATVARWLRSVADPLRQPAPMLIVAIGWLRVLTERAPRLDEIFDAVDAAFQHPDNHYSEAERERATLQADVLKAFAARFAGRYADTRDITTSALERIPVEDAFTRGLATYNLARLEMSLGWMERSASLLARAHDDNLRVANYYLVFTGAGQAAAVRLQLQGVAATRAELAATAAFAQQHHLAALPAYSVLQYHLANVEYCGNRLAEARAAAETARQLACGGNFPEGCANALLMLARVAMAEGALDEAEALLLELGTLCQSSNAVLLDTTVPLEQARLAIRRAHLGVGAAVVLERNVAGAEWTVIHEQEHLLSLQHAMYLRQHAVADELAATLQRESELRGRGVALTTALVARAALTDDESRWDLLEEALLLARARGYARPIIDAGEWVRPLLQSAAARHVGAEAAAYARALLEQIGPLHPVAAPVLIDPLTDRELDVLRYLAGRMSSKAIARAMYISSETVKTHLKHIFWKLGTSDRAAAVARARELGLIEDPPHITH